MTEAIIGFVAGLVAVFGWIGARDVLNGEHGAVLGEKSYRSGGSDFMSVDWLAVRLRELRRDIEEDMGLTSEMGWLLFDVTQFLELDDGHAQEIVGPFWWFSALDRPVEM